MRLIRSTAIVGSMTLLSRILGLLRDILMARFLGAGIINDALITATKLPNLFRRMFAEGAFNAAFIPLYAKRLEADGEKAANEFAGEAFAALLFLVAIIVVLFQLTMPLSLNLIGGGLEKVTHNSDGIIPYDLAVIYARITMPYLIFMSMGALFSGMLNSKNHFAIAAFAPIFLNIVWISLLAAQIHFRFEPDRLALWLAIGMTFSGLLQVAILIYALKHAALKIPFKRPRLTPGVRRLVTLGIPGFIAAGITQINLLVTHNIATLQPGAPSWLYYSDRLYQLPLGMIGIAMGVALLPSLSRSLRAERDDEAMSTLNRATEVAAFLTLPAAAALFVIPDFLVSTLFERGRFLPSDSIQTAKALKMFALGLPAFVLIKILTPTFFAREDTRTPMIFACISAVINVAFGFLFFFTLGFFGLALATSIAAWANVLCLAVIQKKRGHFIIERSMPLRLFKMICASALMGAAVFYIAQWGEGLITGALVWDYFVLLIVCGLGLLVYALINVILRTFQMVEIKNAFKKSG